ncbi:hypothetical protein LJ739_00600 [Aestuariibacter halophilus]|uniref:PKHD-type hydroxylase C-terminal domain-containing protein n=1 Tax=Fluctibacter halophilus TaxID=226011 RepID=A0ABS8G2N9_9ALTE|nr:hypothetical protein [Aestuariibacter halophilus]MCC2614738.1 hypothetical protein [Aestuariibacter halophilus]
MSKENKPAPFHRAMAVQPLRDTLFALEQSIQRLLHQDTVSRDESDRLHNDYHNLIRQCATVQPVLLNVFVKTDVLSYATVFQDCFCIF